MTNPSRRLLATLALIGSAALAACASTGREEYLFHGPDRVLSEFVAASKACGYADIEKSLGNHLEPIVTMTIPEPRTKAFACAWDWAKAHVRDGLTNEIPEDY